MLYGGVAVIDDPCLCCWSLCFVCLAPHTRYQGLVLGEELFLATTFHCSSQLRLSHFFLIPYNLQLNQERNCPLYIAIRSTFVNLKAKHEERARRKFNPTRLLASLPLVDRRTTIMAQVSQANELIGLQLTHHQESSKIPCCAEQAEARPDTSFHSRRTPLLHHLPHPDLPKFLYESVLL